MPSTAAPTREDMSFFAPHLEDRICILCEDTWNPEEDGDLPQHIPKFHGIMKGACTPCYRRFMFGLWADASSWSQIVFLNYLFIQGVLHSTPYHSGPLFAESEGLTAGFKRLHSYGIFTKESQPYSHEHFVNFPHAPGRIAECKQRLCLCFSIPTSHPLLPRRKVEALMQGLFNHREIYATITSDTHEYPRSVTRLQGAAIVEAVGNTDRLYSFQASGERRKYTVSKSGMAETEELLPEAKFDRETVAWGRYHGHALQGVLHGFCEALPIYSLGANIKLLDIEVFARAWNVDLDLQALV